MARGSRRIVVKVGTSSLTDEAGHIDAGYISDLATQVARVRGQGFGVVVVSSGAIAAGIERLGLESRPTDMPSLQAAASVGSVALAETYSSEFSNAGMVTGQVLLTRNDTTNRESYLHARDTFDRLLDLGVVPIVNENDTVAVEEIKFGDNDTLAALVATMIGAELVVLLSDIEGFYDMDPRGNDEAQLLQEVEELTADLICAAGGSGTSRGTGGMATKVEAARVLMKAGIPMVICEGHRADALVDAVAGKLVGTRFCSSQESVNARKMWIALGHKAKGRIVIDDGALMALRTKGTSLLPVGVVSVSGRFDCGDAVVLIDSAGLLVARGLTQYSSEELEHTRGLRMAQVGELYEHLEGKAVIHRDQLVVL